MGSYACAALTNYDDAPNPYIRTVSIENLLTQLLNDLPRRVPRSTYRLQLSANFDFADARALLSYLAQLGISELYFSPMQTPRANSVHGYDICDHNQLNPALGGVAAFDDLASELVAQGMGLIIDVVPNHMGIDDPRNLWWSDVLENGPGSSYAPFFDIDWNPASISLRDKVLLPVLGDQYGVILERGELKLSFEEGVFALRYWDHHFPIAPDSFDALLGHRLAQLSAELGDEHADLQELQSIITAVGYLPARGETARERIAERNREKEIIKRRLAALYTGSPGVRDTIDATLADYNGDPTAPGSFDMLDALINRQAYRLAFWRVATEEINYRRFFDINDLAAISVERPEVFQATHRLIFELLSAGKASGLRIDHPDGLWNPPAYFRQLQEGYLLAWAAARLASDDETLPANLADQVHRWVERAVLEPASQPGDHPRWPLYVVAEKILSADEPLPEEWAVDGTTGYDMLNDLNGIFVDPASARRFDQIYADFLAYDGERLGPYADLVNARKKQIMLVALASEVNALSNLLDRLSEKTRRYRDFTLNSLTFAIREIIAALPIYRTYIDGPQGPHPRDSAFINAAVEEAKQRNPRTASAIFDFIGATLLLSNLADFAEEHHDEVLHFVMKFQQISGPVMAKGVEDTLFYGYNRLVSLNEVGGHPEHFGTSVEHFHQRNSYRMRRWPHTMTATSTHDTKRSEDVRARINVLSELPREWRTMLGRWSRQNARKKIGTWPTRNDEYLFYQTLIGIWPEPELSAVDAEPLAPNPAFSERIIEYMLKAAKEAKVHTSWVNPDAEYDGALREFVQRTLASARRNPFLASFLPFQRRVAYFGRLNALSQALLKLAAPGVPDIYQGCELWNLSLVDPDNRRPVDYALRQVCLAQLKAREADEDRLALVAELLENAFNGRVKLYVTWKLLELRRTQPQIFAEGDYRPLTAHGLKAANVVAFARAAASSQAIAVAPRLVVGLTGGVERLPLGDEVWGETWLELPQLQAGEALRNLFTADLLHVDKRDGVAGLPLSSVLAHFPVALLIRE